MNSNSPDVADRRIQLAVREVIEKKMLGNNEPVNVTIVLTGASGRPDLMAQCYLCSRILRGTAIKDPVTGLLRHKGCGGNKP